jgi:hypothetical protein
LFSCHVLITKRCICVVCCTGANYCYEVCFPALAALLVDVPSWVDRQALAATEAVKA